LRCDLCGRETNERILYPTLTSRVTREIRDCLWLCPTCSYVEWYREQGFSFFPLKSKSKEPALPSWKTYQERRPTDEEITAWRKSQAFGNVAVVTGSVSGNLVVLDFDDWSVYEKVFPKHGELEKLTFVVKTARGVHVYFRSGRNPGRTEKFETLKFEYRANGSYVVAPFSVHPSGAIYKRIGVLELLQVDDAREELQNILKRLGYTREFQDVMKDAAKNVALTGKPYRGPDPPCVQELLKGVDMGMRNNTCIKLASYFLAFRKKPVKKAFEILLDWNKRNRPPLEELEIKRVVRSEAGRGYRFGCSSFSQTCRPALCTLVFKRKETINVDVDSRRLVMATTQYTFPTVNNRVLLLKAGVDKTAQLTSREQKKS
jgi:hypothetical protein